MVICTFNMFEKNYDFADEFMDFISSSQINYIYGLLHKHEFEVDLDDVYDYFDIDKNRSIDRLSKKEASKIIEYLKEY